MVIIHVYLALKFTGITKASLFEVVGIFNLKYPTK